jgi:prepilin peptidase CpaA
VPPDLERRLDDSDSESDSPRIQDAYRETIAMLQVHLIPASIVLAAAMTAAVMDVWKFKVYNALTVPLLLTGLVYHAIAGGTQGFLGSLLGVLCGFAILFVVYSMGGVGAGDVKLMAAVGAWLGMPLTLYVFVASALASATYALALILLWGSVHETWIDLQVALFRIMALGHHLGSDVRLEDEMKRPDRRRRLVPFGAMVAVGFAAILAWCISSEIYKFVI